MHPIARHGVSTNHQKMQQEFEFSWRDTISIDLGSSRKEYISTFSLSHTTYRLPSNAYMRLDFFFFFWLGFHLYMFDLASCTGILYIISFFWMLGKKKLDDEWNTKGE